MRRTLGRVWERANPPLLFSRFSRRGRFVADTPLTMTHRLDATGVFEFALPEVGVLLTMGAFSSDLPRIAEAFEAFWDASPPDHPVRTRVKERDVQPFTEAEVQHAKKIMATMPPLPPEWFPDARMRQVQFPACPGVTLLQVQP